MSIADDAIRELTEMFTSVADASPYLYPIPFHCSKDCGQPVRMGEMFVQTSPDKGPLTRAHAACMLGRKGLDATRGSSAEVAAQRAQSEWIAGQLAGTPA